MTMFQCVVLGTAPYASHIPSQGCYSAVDPLTVNSNGLFIKRTDEFRVDLADENGRTSGVTAPGSRDPGIFNIYDLGNSDAVAVLTLDVSIAVDSLIYVAAGGMATAVVPLVDHFVVGYAKSPVKPTTLCDGTPASCVCVVLEKVSSFVAVALPPFKKSSKEVSNGN